MRFSGVGGREVGVECCGIQGCEVRCEVLSEHGAGSCEHEDKQSQLQFQVSKPLAYCLEGESPPHGHGLGKMTLGMVGQKGDRGGAWA